MTFKNHLQDPFLWIAVGTIVVTIVTSLNQVENNTRLIHREKELLNKELETMKKRMEEKILIINNNYKEISLIKEEQKARSQSIQRLKDLEEEVEQLKIEVNILTYENNRELHPE